jgi:hypothetical protein
MLGLQHKPLSQDFGAPAYTGPVLESATIKKGADYGTDGSYAGG